MDRDQAFSRVISSMQEGADLRVKVARDHGHSIVEGAMLLVESFSRGGKLLLFGNGGSAADAQHLAAEFVGRFVRHRAALPAIALTTDSSILTAVGNDYGFDQVFSRQIEALGRPNDVAIAISTSGNSPNVIEAVKKAKEQKIKTIGLAGNDGGALAKVVDIGITVPVGNTARIQECHIAIGHILCELVESEIFKM